MKKVAGLLALVILILSCKKQTESLNVVTSNDLYPIAVGKSFTYKMDSTIPINFGDALEVHSYQAKDSIESTFLDATGRTSFRIYRYTRDTLATQPWIYAATYYATTTSQRVEYVDNNLRFVTLANPVSYNTSWKGNAHINTVLPSTYYYLDNWDYHYTDLDQPYTCLKGEIQNTYTVFQQNSQVQQGTFNPAFYDEKSYSIEVYGKGIGLIYKEFLHYIWQPSDSKYDANSWGVKLNLIDYK